MSELTYILYRDILQLVMYNNNCIRVALYNHFREIRKSIL